MGGLSQLPLTFSLLSLIPVSLTEIVLDGAILEPEAKGENPNIDRSCLYFVLCAFLALILTFKILH